MIGDARAGSDFIFCMVSGIKTPVTAVLRILMRVAAPAIKPNTRSLFQKKAILAKAKKHFENVVSLLDNLGPDEEIPYSDGLTAERLKDIVHSVLASL